MLVPTVAPYAASVLDMVLCCQDIQCTGPLHGGTSTCSARNSTEDLSEGLEARERGLIDRRREYAPRVSPHPTRQYWMPYRHTPRAGTAWGIVIRSR
eukprot:2746764-Rhodomonas_salina.1